MQAASARQGLGGRDGDGGLTGQGVSKGRSRIRLPSWDIAARLSVDALPLCAVSSSSQEVVTHRLTASEKDSAGD